MDVYPKPGFNFGKYQNPIFIFNFKDVPIHTIEPISNSDQFAEPVLSPNDAFARAPEDNREQQRDSLLRKNTKPVLCALVKLYQDREKDLKSYNNFLLEQIDRLMRSEMAARREAGQLSKDNQVLNDKVRILQSELSKVKESNDALTRDVTALQMNLEGKRVRILQLWVDDDRKKARIDNNE